MKPERQYTAENFLWAAHKYNLRLAELIMNGRTPRCLQSQYSDYKGFLENILSGQSILYGYSFLDCLANKLLKTKRWRTNKKGRRVKNAPSLYNKWASLFHNKPGKCSHISAFLRFASTLRVEIPHSKPSWSLDLQPTSYNYRKAKKFHLSLIGFLKYSIDSKRYQLKSEYVAEIARFVSDPDMWVDTWLQILKSNL